MGIGNLLDRFPPWHGLNGHFVVLFRDCGGASQAAWGKPLYIFGSKWRQCVSLCVAGRCSGRRLWRESAQLSEWTRVWAQLLCRTGRTTMKTTSSVATDYG